MSSPTNTKLRVSNIRQANHAYNTDIYEAADRQGAALISQRNLPLYTHAINGSLFHGMNVTAGSAIAADDATAPIYSVWNPSDSGVNVVPVIIRIGCSVLGTRVVSALGLNFVQGTGTGIADASPVTAFASTPTAIKSATYATGTSSKVLFSNTGTVTASATTTFFTLGFSHDLITVGNMNLGVFYLDGALIIPPGTLVYPAFHQAASGSTYLFQMSWLEIPRV